MDQDTLPVTFTCPTTGEPFIPQRYRVQDIRGHRFLWVWCALCDAYDRPFADPQYDPAMPQVHCIHLLAECAVGE